MIYWADIPDGTIDIYLVFVPLTGHYLIGHCQKWQGNEAELGGSIQTCSVHHQQTGQAHLFCWSLDLFYHLFGLSKWTSAVCNFLPPANVSYWPTAIQYSTDYLYFKVSVSKDKYEICCRSILLLDPLEEPILSILQTSLFSLRSI